MPMAILKFNRGLTLVEVMVSVALLSVAITAASVLMAKTIKDFSLTARQISDLALAQKQIETLRNQRDNNPDSLSWDAEGKYEINAQVGAVNIKYRLYDWK